MPPYQNCTYFRETGRAVSMKPPMPRQVLQLPPLTPTDVVIGAQLEFELNLRGLGESIVE